MNKENQLGKSSLNLPLCVDLDGTLMHSDALWESAVRSFFRAPFHTVAGLSSLRKGRAAFKDRMLRHGEFDVALLPYNRPLIARLEKEKSNGRKIVLVTAADQRVAESVSSHLGLFDQVYASNSGLNLKGPDKAALLVKEFGEHQFVYAGDSRADQVVWQRAAAAWTVGELGASVASDTDVLVEEKFEGLAPRVSDWLAASRWQSLISNVAVFLPLAAAGQFFKSQFTVATLVAFFCLCLAAFGTYLLSDLARLDTDRINPEKEGLPVAQGKIPLLTAGMISACLLPCALVASLILSPSFCVILLAFSLSIFVLPTVHTLWPGAALFVRSWLNFLRILAGFVVAPVATPGWFWVVAAPLCLILALLTKKAGEL